MLRLRPLAVLLSLALALCLLGLWSVRSQTGALRRVTNTTEDGVNVNPSLSGDGRRISFESTKDLAGAGGNGFHALRADLSSDPATFVQMGVTRAPAPGISQDGSIIAFASKDDPLGTNSDGNSEIFLYNGTLRQITNTTPSSPQERTRQGNFQPSLTDDGRFIAFSSNRNLANQNADANLEVFIFDTTTSTFTQLTNTSGAVGAADAKISGDGARVAYIRDANATPAVQRDLVLQDRSGANTRTLAANVTNIAFTFGRAISDDGQRIVYAADIAPNRSQVFLFDGRTTNSIRQITALGEREVDVPLHPTISGDGTRIAFATRRPVTGISNTDNSVELYTYDIPTGQFARVTNATSTSDGFDGSLRAADVVSSLSDDGSIVAFNFPRTLSGAVTSGFENNTEIYVTGTAVRPGTGQLTILNGASFGHEPATTEAVAPDSIAVALGGALSFETERAQRQPDGSFPRTLRGTTVTVNGRSAQIFYVSPEQVNFHVPAETELGTAEVVVTNAEGFQSRGTIQVLRAAPGIFTLSGDGLGEGMILNADTLQPGPFDPSSGNLRLVIFSTGVRRATQVTATAGGRALTVESVMQTPNMPGMDEVRVLVPADLRGAGTVDLVIRADTRDSNPVSVTFSGDSCRDIVINEVLADPPDGLAGDANHDGVRDSGDDEFIELVNRTTHDIDISGYQLTARSTASSTDTVRHTFAPGTIFPSGSAIVVFGGGNPNPSDPAFGGALILKASSGALSLTNSGGFITLRQPSQDIVNIFSYGGSTGLNGDANQSLTRSPDAGVNSECATFVPHSTAPDSGGRPFSPGTHTNGTPFATNTIARIEVSPTSATIDAGAKQQFTATAYDAGNNVVSGVIFFWQSSNTGVATIDQTGLATGVSAGTTEIRASAHGVQSAPAILTVRDVARVLTSVEVTPSSATIPVGGTQQFTARGLDQFGNEIVGLTFTWESTNTTVATIDQTGLATGVSQGQTTIRATSQGVSGTATLNVTPPTIVINEVLADPPDGLAGDSNHDGVRDSGDDEFIELVNSTSNGINISGWTIRTRATNSTTESVRHTFATSTTLPAGEAIVVFGGGNPDPANGIFACAQVVTTSSASGLSLTNSGLTVVVRDSAGNLVAQFTYGGSTGLNGDSNQSLTRSPDITGGFTLHTTASGANGRRFSPGAKVNGSPFGSCPPRLTSVTISPPSSSITTGQTTQFTAQAFDQFGNPITGATITFVSDNTTVATIESVTTDSNTGIATATVRGNSPGTAHITAQASDGTTTVTSSPATLTVNSPTPVLATVTISPPSATVDIGQTQQFTAQALDQFGQPIGGVTITFASNNTTVATVDSVSPTSSTGSATATVTGRANGSAEIRATATDGTTTVTSTPATVAVAHLVNAGEVLISEFRTRGPAGASDEFVELYNPTTSTVPIGGLKIRASNSSGTTSDRVTITAGATLGAGCHYLVANTSYSGSVTPNQTYGTGIADDGGIAITRSDGTTVLDQVGMSNGSAYKEGTTLAPLSANVDQSYERKPGGAFGNGTDTNNNASDFLLNAASSNPQNLSSGCLDVTTADLGITKTDSPDPVITGSDVTYTITVTNNGAGTAQSVVVTDDLPASVSFVSCSSTGGGVCNGTGNSRTITFPSLPGGASATITLVATVNGAAGTTITNTATVSSTTPDSNASNNSATATTSVQAPLPTVSIDDVVITEGDSGTKTATFNVTLSASSTQTVTVGYATSSASPATATAGTDYQSTSGTLTFNPGETTKPVNVTINGDTLVEPNETFFVDLSGATNAIIADGQGQGTITNDDTANLVISQVYGGGNNSGALYQRDFIELFNRGTTTVDFSITNYSVQYASSGANFGSSKTDLTSGTIAPGHYFLIQEAGGTTNGAPLPTPDATGTIAMGNTSGKVALVAGTASLPAAICPGDDGVAPFNPSNAAIADFIGYGSVSCYEGATGPAPAPDNTTADFRRAGGCTDTDNNAADFFIFAPNPRNSATPTNNCNAGIAPNLTISDATVTEGNSGTVTATFTVQLSAPANGTDVTFDISTQNNTALSGSDYVARSLTNQIIPAGQQTYTFSVTVNGDTTVEPDETFFVNVTNAAGATVTDGQGVGTIQNDDLPSLSINDVTHSEGNSATTFTFTVSLSAPAPANVTFDIATADGTAQDGTPSGEDNDYIARSLTGQTIAAGQQTFTFDVTVNGDTTVEPGETFFVNVTNISGATALDTQGLGTIQNDDSPPSPIVSSVVVTPSPVTINRGQTQQFTATAFDPSNQPVPSATFTWSSSNTAVATVDSNGLATGVGIGTTTITATTADGMGGNISGTATLTVQVPLVINEILPQVPTDAAGTPAIEGDSNRDGVRDSDDDEFIELLNNSNAPVNISGVIISDSTNNRFTFPANTTLAAGRAVVVFGGGSPPVNDPAFGGALIFTTSSLGMTDTGDTITVKLVVAGSDVVIDSVAYGTGNPIPAPGAQSLTRSPDAAVGTMGGAFVQHTTATNAAGRVFSPGTRTDGTPFGSPAITRIEVLPASASINIGATQAFTATAYSNAGGPEVAVPNVSFIWDSSDPTKATVAPMTGASTTATGVAAGSSTIRAQAGGQQGTAALTINAPLTLSINDVTHNEGNSGPTTYTFTVSLSAIAPATVTFDIATQDNTATVADSDYVAKSMAGQSIPAGQQTYTFDVTINGDIAIEPNETFFVNVTNVSGATVTKGQGVGTIQNDDVAGIPQPTAGQVIINEALVASSTTNTTRPDFLELYNTTNQTLDISGLVISFRPGGVGNTPSTVTLPGTVGSATTTIAANSYFIIVNGASVLNGASVAIAADYNPGAGNFDLNGTGGGIKIEINGVKLDGLTYQGSATAINATFVAYGEGSIFTFTSATTNDLVRSATSADTNNNANDFRHLSSSTTITPKAVNPP